MALNDKQIEEAALRFGMGHFVSNDGNQSYEELYRLLQENVDGDMPDEITVWKPFEDKEPGELLELVNDQISSYKEAMTLARDGGGETH